jgi:hypothetical protein
MAVQALDFSDSSRAVIRHCTFNNSGMTSHGLDTSLYGARHWEIYNNNFIFSTSGTSMAGNPFPLNLNWWFFCRGGTGVIFNNVMPDISSQQWGNKASILFTVFNIRRMSAYVPCQTTWPAIHQVGQGYSNGLVLDPAYIWGNSDGTTYNNPGTSDWPSDDCGNGLLSESFIQEGRDYYVNTPKPGYTPYIYPHPLRSTVGGATPVSDPLLWRNSRTGEVAIWLMNGINVSQSAMLGRAGLNWQVLGTGDFTGQGNSDILWSNKITRELAIWFMNGVSVTGSQDFFLHGVGGTVQAIGDLEGNGFADLIFRNSENGNTWVVLNNGPPNFSVSWSGKVPPNWVIAGLADVSGNGTPQLIWRNIRTGRVSMWYFSNGVPSQSIVLGSVGLNWVIKAFGDLSGDGREDIVWQNSISGAVSVWYSGGTQFSASAVLGRVPSRWAMRGVAHLNGNGPGQIIWRNAWNGQVWAWTVNGSAFSGTLLPSHLGLNWELQPAQPVNP